MRRRSWSSSSRGGLLFLLLITTLWCGWRVGDARAWQCLGPAALRKAAYQASPVSASLSWRRRRADGAAVLVAGGRRRPPCLPLFAEGGSGGGAASNGTAAAAAVSSSSTNSNNNNNRIKGDFRKPGGPRKGGAGHVNRGPHRPQPPQSPPPPLPPSSGSAPPPQGGFVHNYNNNMKRGPSPPPRGVASPPRSGPPAGGNRMNGGGGGNQQRFPPHQQRPQQQQQHRGPPPPPPQQQPPRRQPPQPEPPGAEDAESLSDFTRLCKVLSLSADQYPESQEELEQVFGGTTRPPIRLPLTEQVTEAEADAAAAAAAASTGSDTSSSSGSRDGSVVRPAGRRVYSNYNNNYPPNNNKRGGPPGGPQQGPGQQGRNGGNGGGRYMPRNQQQDQEGRAEEVLAPMETLGLRKRHPVARAAGGGSSPRSPSSSAKGEESDGEEYLEDENAKADEDEEASDDEDFALSGEGGSSENGVLTKDKRVVSNQIKDAKLTEYIKDKKKARSSRDRFLADTGLVRSEVHPPQRFIEVYYNSWADDFYTAITTSSSSFGPRWWFREALGHDPTDIMTWVRHWMAMAAKHGVLHDSVAALVQDALSVGGPGEEDNAVVETDRFMALKARLRERREPKVIAIGDVHGCIDEVRALLKKAEYSPGDLVVFLGDMVAKGPESIQVIRLAREIGALSVRGNHENEVIRWSRALALGAQSNFKSEHYLIAMGLEEADVEWLRNLPWYISCSDLQLLFVHAGFVANQRLSKQHPRFMINMRSILADGTVSARYYQDYPWARTWQGPQTVLFGHDARRGIQLYDQAMGIDTGCVYGGNLTACVLPNKEFVQVPAAEPYIVNRYDRIMKRAQLLQKEGIVGGGMPPPPDGGGGGGGGGGGSGGYKGGRRQ